MPHVSSDVQVVVVGAGPTGLVLACELLAHGIATRILDKGDGIALQTRALGVHARTLEVLDTMGLADEFVANGQQIRTFRWYSDGRSIATLDMSLNASRFPFMLDIPQHVTEQLLRRRVRELGGRVEPRAELIRLAQHADGVTATVRECDGGVRSINGDYLVGCDGAHSRVRHELGLRFEGHAYDEDWLLADVQMSWERREDEVHAFFRSRGAPMICFPMRDHLWRLVFPYTGDRAGRPPTLEEIQQLLDERSPERARASHPTWLANFRCHRRSTHTYRCGRVLLAGDAVHVHSPAGGQGMNTGIMDAQNLAWKLALVCQGRAREQLLETYAEERQPVAAEVLELTHGLVELATLKDPLKRAIRDALLPIASRLPVVSRRAVRRLSQEYVQYRQSSITAQEDSAISRLRPGDRAPDVTVVVPGSGRMRLYEALRLKHHLLAIPESSDASVPDLAGLADVVETVFGSVQQHDRAPWLVRPDGYLAARGQDGIERYARAFTPTTRWNVRQSAQTVSTRDS